MNPLFSGRQVHVRKDPSDRRNYLYGLTTYIHLGVLLGKLELGKKNLRFKDEEYRMWDKIGNFEKPKRKVITPTKIKFQNFKSDTICEKRATLFKTRSNFFSVIFIGPFFPLQRIFQFSAPSPFCVKFSEITFLRFMSIVDQVISFLYKKQTFFS